MDVVDVAIQLHSAVEFFRVNEREKTQCEDFCHQLNFCDRDKRLLADTCYSGGSFL